MSYLDPAILRLGSQPIPPRGERSTLTVTSPIQHYKPGDRVSVARNHVDDRTRTVTVSTYWVTVVSWDPELGELVVDHDAPDWDPTAARPAKEEP